MAEDLTPPQYLCTASISCPSVTRLEDGDKTPKHLRCGVGSCPSVTAVSGDLLIVGKRADQIARDLGKGVGPDEYAILVHPDQLDTVFAQWQSAVGVRNPQGSQDNG